MSSSFGRIRMRNDTSLNSRRKPVRAAFSAMELMMVVAVIALLAAVFLPQWMKRQRNGSKGLSCVNNQKQIGLAFKIWALDNNDHFPMQVSITNGGTKELVAAGNVWPHFVVMSNELSTPKILVCPEEWQAHQKKMASLFSPIPAALSSPVYGGNAPVPLTNDDRVSYFVGVDADDSKPAMWLGGDHNLQFAGKPASHGLYSLRTNTPVQWYKPRHEGGGYILLSDGSVSLTSTDVAASLIGTGVATNRLAMP